MSAAIDDTGTGETIHPGLWTSTNSYLRNQAGSVAYRQEQKDQGKSSKPDSFALVAPVEYGVANGPVEPTAPIQQGHTSEFANRTPLTLPSEQIVKIYQYAGVLPEAVFTDLGWVALKTSHPLLRRVNIVPFVINDFVRTRNFWRRWTELIDTTETIGLRVTPEGTRTALPSRFGSLYMIEIPTRLFRFLAPRHLLSITPQESKRFCLCWGAEVNWVGDPRIVACCAATLPSVRVCFDEFGVAGVYFACTTSLDLPPSASARQKEFFARTPSEHPSTERFSKSDRFGRNLW